MSLVASMIQLHDVDAILLEARNTRLAGRLKKLGFEIGPTAALEKVRARVAESIDPRWLNHYDRAMKRYGRGIAVVRQRVCQGCFITLPTSATPGAGDPLTLCESCGRVLYWP